MIRLSSFALLFFCTAASADSLAPIVVNAGSDTDGPPPQIGDVVLDEHTGSHTRIDKQQLQKPGSSLGESLAFEAGVQHRQAGAEGSYSAVTLRGASAAQTPVFWDGIRLNNAAQAAVDLSDLEMLNLESVDIYRGSTPMQLGGGIGGAVALNSPRTAGDSASLRLHAGSFGSRGLQLGMSKPLGKLQTQLALSHRSADNAFPLTNDNGTTFNTNDDREEHRNNAAFQRDALLGKVRYSSDEDTQYDASVQYTKRDMGVPEWRNLENNQASYNTRTTVLQLNQRKYSFGNSNWNTRFGLHGQDRTEEYDDRLSRVGLGAQLTRTDSSVLGLNAFAERVADLHTLSVQAEIRSEAMHSEDLIDNVEADATRLSQQLSAQYQWFSPAEQWQLGAGLEWQTLQDIYDGLYRDGKDSRDSDHIGANLRAKFRPSDILVFQFTLGQSHREPSFYELFGDRGLHVGNNQLLAESGINTDISALWSHNSGELQIGAFYSDRSNLIATVFSAQGIGRSVNIGGAQVRGIELSGVQTIRPQWSIKGSATLQDAINQSRIVAFNDKQLPGEAQFQAALRLNHDRAQSNWWFEASSQGGKFYDTANLLDADAHTVFNAGTTLQHQRWQYAFTINNLSDQRIEDFNGFIKPGRSAHLSARFLFNHL